jgi:hypothetical protein
MDLKEIEIKDTGRIHMAQDRIPQRGLQDVVMSLHERLVITWLSG